MSDTPAPSHRLLWPLLALALALRIGAMLAWPNVHQADEVFQVLEPAHRLWFGYGVVPWEWRVGIRSWLLPGLLAPVIGTASALGLGPAGYMAVVGALMSLLSLSVVAVGYGLGRRFYGRAGALLVGGLCAVWFAFIYFAPKIFTEVAAAHVLIIAVWFAITAPRRLVLIGLLLGLTFILRFHTAPVLLLVAAWVCRADMRGSWPRLLAGAAVPVLFQAVLDWLTLGLPLQSVWLNFWINVGEARSDIYGVLPFYWYPGRLLISWGSALPLVLAAAALGARRAPLLGWMVLLHLLAHSLIGHKELRFLYPLLPPLLILAGLGLCRLLARFQGFARGELRVPLLALAVLGAISVAGATNPGFIGNWTAMTGALRGTDWLRGQPDLCGLGLVHGPDWQGYWTPSGGYARLHRDIPFHIGADASALAAQASSFNYALLPQSVGDKLAGYARLRCAPGGVSDVRAPDEPDWCVYRRPGACVPAPGETINRVLERLGE